MNAIELLKDQHRQVESLFEQFEEAEGGDEKREIFFEIADQLAVHATIEERFFYPAIRARQTEEQLEEAFDEHLEVKKLLLDGLRATDKPGFDGLMAAIKGAVEHHVEEEEEEMFPNAEKLLGRDGLEAVGQRMEAEAAELLAAGQPRRNIKAESEQPAV